MYSIQLDKDKLDSFHTDKSFSVKVKYYKNHKSCNRLFLPKKIVTLHPQENNKVLLLLPNWLYKENKDILKLPELNAKICKLK